MNVRRPSMKNRQRSAVKKATLFRVIVPIFGTEIATTKSFDKIYAEINLNCVISFCSLF